MIKKTLLLAAAVLALQGCEYKRTISGTFDLEGKTFSFVRTNIEDVNPLGEDAPYAFVYTVTMPDGTKTSTYARDDGYAADLSRRRVAQDWLEANGSKPGRSRIVAGPPESPQDLPYDRTGSSAAGVFGGPKGGG